MSAHALCESSRTFRQIAARDLPQVSRFLAAQIDANGMQGTQKLPYYRWKFFSGGLNLCFGGFVDGQLVGFLGRVARPFWLDGQAVTFTEGTDAFVERRFQGTGLFQRLVATARRAVVQAGVAFSSARPNRNSEPGALRAGHRRLCELQLYTRPVAASYLAERLCHDVRLRGLLEPASDLALRLSGWPLWAATRLSRARFEPIARFDERMDALWREDRARVDAAVVHDQAYMNWRYVDCPIAYECLAIASGDELEAVIVSKLVPANGEEPVAGEIVDYVSSPRDHGQLAYLLVGQAMRQLSQAGARVVRCLLPPSTAGRDPLHVGLRLNGFIRRPAADTSLLVRPEADNLAVERLIARGSWRFRGGDIDSL